MIRTATQAARRRRPRVLRARAAARGDRRPAQSAAETQAIVEGVLRARRYRTLSSDDGTVHLYADRYRWAPFAGPDRPPSHRRHPRGRDRRRRCSATATRSFTIAEGVHALGRRRGRACRSSSSTSPTRTTRRPAPRSTTRARSSSTRTARRSTATTIRVNDPLRYGDTTFYQAFFGSAAVMTVKDAGRQASSSRRACRCAWQVDGRRPPARLVYTVPGTDYVVWIVGHHGRRPTRPDQARPGARSSSTTPATARRSTSKVIDQGTADHHRRPHGDVRPREPVHAAQRRA